jgi:phage terminase small subunit
LPDRRLAVLKGDGRNRGYPRAVVAAPDKPSDLEPEAERLWVAVVPELERLRLMTAPPVDRDELERSIFGTDV